MSETIKKMLEGEIEGKINNLSSLPSGSAEESKAIANLSALYKLSIEESRNENDFAEKCDRRIMDDKQRQSEAAFREKQLAEQVKDRYFRLGVEAVSVILPLIFYAVWMKKGFKFEENGTYTSTTFRGLFGRFKPTKK